MTHNQVTYLLGKRGNEIKSESVEVDKERLDLEEDIADYNKKANSTGQAIGTAIGVAAIVVSIIIACLW